VRDLQVGVSQFLLANQQMKSLSAEQLYAVVLNVPLFHLILTVLC
jgi:hypothetical protein